MLITTDIYSAYDDASGVATILGIAKAIRDSGYGPEKTIRIICHGAEEWGKAIPNTTGQKALMSR